MKRIMNIAWVLGMVSLMQAPWAQARGLSEIPPAQFAKVEIQTTAPEEEPERPLVQIAILLDTSGSMSGLIEQTKGQLWKIINEFILAKQDGVRPELEVALYEYGKSSLSPKDGFLRQIQPLTTDLDAISEDLFALKTNGGSEYCGWVIREAVARLKWSDSPDDYKVIFIAGNEPFTQGPVPFAEACKAAIEKGIMVNTIHCGNEQVGIKTQWQQGALLAEGKYMFINHNKAVVHFDTPQDAEIARLGEALNKTYIGFGDLGAANTVRQSLQDANSVSLSAQGASVNRALFKASGLYRNANWDLVDACLDGSVKLSELKPDQLPEKMKKMTPEERKAYVAEKTKERADLKAQIKKLNSDRNKFIEETLNKQQKDGGEDTLDSVMISVIREQAGKKNYVFE